MTRLSVDQKQVRAQRSAEDERDRIHTALSCHVDTTSSHNDDDDDAPPPLDDKDLSDVSSQWGDEHAATRDSDSGSGH